MRVDVVDGGAAFVGEREGFGAAIVGAFLAGDELAGHQAVDDAGGITGVAVQGTSEGAHGGVSLRDGIECVHLYDSEVVFFGKCAQTGLQPAYKTE